MIAFTYATSGILLAITAMLFQQGLLDATTQTIAWMVIFFFASAAASSAYLTVSESFPLEVRAFAIALFYVLGTAVGGVAGPWLFGSLIESGTADDIVIGYLLGAALMIGAAVVELWHRHPRRAAVARVRLPHRCRAATDLRSPPDAEDGEKRRGGSRPGDP